MSRADAAAYDVVVVGAGIVGACCALELVRARLSVCVVDRGGVASGTTGGGEGNILVSDKSPGPELDLALLSRALWFELVDELPRAVELEAKGGVIVTATENGLGSLAALSSGQRDAGIEAYDVDAAGLRELEPHLAPTLLGGVHYPQDMQVQPMLAAAHLLRRARDLGAALRLRTEVLGAVTGAGGAVVGVATDRGPIACRWIVNAAGTWGGEVSMVRTSEE